MGHFNLGAVLFALLLLVWLGYAVPRTAQRRDVMGRTAPIDRARDTVASRDLTRAAHARRRPPEVHTAMPAARLLSSPTSPAHDDAPALPAGPTESTPAHPAHVERPDAGTRAALRGALVALLAATALAIVLAGFSVVAWYIPLLPLAALAVLVAVLRRSELSRRETARHEASARRRAIAASHPTPAALPATGNTADAAAPVDTVTAAITAPAAPADPRTWTPRPVPRPTYTLQAEVDDIASRHIEHRASVLGASTPLEAEGVEVLEAAAEDSAAIAPPADLDLDAILARRRA